jgi:sulfur carrier protein ThiS
LKIRVKLVAHAGKAVAGIGPNGEGALEVPDGASVADVMARLDVARETLTMTLVNDTAVRPALHDSHIMVDGDVLTVFPPIEGG